MKLLHLSLLNLPPSAMAALVLSGCGTTQPATAVDSKTAIANIASLQDRARSAAVAFRHSHPATDATYISVRSKYRDAAAKNKGYLAAVMAGVMNREKNFDTPSYRNIAKDAGETEQQFVDLAEQNTPADVRPAGIVGLAAAAIADILLQSGIAIWKAYNEAEAAKAQAVANSLKQYEWPAWESL